jgi:hypothetical protein
MAEEQTRAAGPYTKLRVLLAAETTGSLARFMRRHDLNATDAVQSAILLTDMVDRALEQGDRIQVIGKNGGVKDLVIT